MDPRACNCTQELLRFRQVTSEKLDDLQQHSDIIIEDAKKPVDDKKEEITKLIATIRKEMEEEEFSDIVSQQIIKLIDHFEGKIIPTSQRCTKTSP